MCATSYMNLPSLSFQRPKMKNISYSMQKVSISDNRSDLQLLAQSPSLPPFYPSFCSCTEDCESFMWTLGKKTCFCQQLQFLEYLSLVQGELNQVTLNSWITVTAACSVNSYSPQVLLKYFSDFFVVFHFGYIQLHITRC